MKQLTENHFTEVGTQQFFEHTKLMTLKVRDVISSKNPRLLKTASVVEGLIKMTSEGFGAVVIVDDHLEPIGIFTDGDLRRFVSKNPSINIADKKFSELNLNRPKTINADSLLIDAQNTLKDNEIDQLVVESSGKVIGMLDIQDIMKS